MTVLRYTVPWAPVGQNHALENHPGGKHLTAEAQSFRLALAMFGQQARRAARFATVPKPELVDVLITVYRQDERQDSDAPVKMIRDSLQETRASPNPASCRIGAGVIQDDHQIRDYHVRPRLDPERPRIEIAVGLAGEVFTLSELLEQVPAQEPV